MRNTLIDYIPRESCIEGHIYRLHSRNLSTGVFDGISGFIGIREKFGSRFLFREFHWDDGPPFGTVKPLEDLGAIPDNLIVFEHVSHPDGNLWLRMETENRPVVRRDLQPEESPHGTRQGFVDLWADTGERLPDKMYPNLIENQNLFAYLKGRETKRC